jgi:hypothetical protein
VVPQALNESWGLFYCINILVSKRDLYLYPTKKINYEKNSISSNYNAYLHYEFRTGNTALLLNARL